MIGVIFTMKRLTALLVLVLVGTAWGANIEKQIKTQKKSQADMKKQIQQYNAIAREKSKQSKTLLSQLSRLKQNANSSQAQISTLEKENSRLADSVSELTRNIDNVNGQGWLWYRTIHRQDAGGLDRKSTRLNSSHD